MTLHGFSLPLALLFTSLVVSMPAAAQDAAPEGDATEGPAEAGTSADAAATDPGMQEARLHFGNGVELLQAEPPNYQDAYQQFLLAEEKSGGNWKVMGNLGLCALKLERDGEALRYYRAYLDGGQDEIEQSERESIEKELLLIQGNLATLRLTSVEPGARVTVARAGSQVPAQLYDLEGEATEIGVRAGEVTIVASSGDKEQSWKVVLSPGQDKAHTFDFAAASSGGAAPAAATQPVSDGGGPTGLQLTGYVTAGVGVLALGGGIVTGVLAKQKESDARAECIGDICPESTQGEFDSASDLAMITNILLISGGVLAATGVTLVIVGGDSGEAAPASARLGAEPAPHKAKPRFAVAPQVGLGGLGLSAYGSF